MVAKPVRGLDRHGGAGCGITTNSDRVGSAVATAASEFHAGVRGRSSTGSEVSAGASQR